MSIAADLAFALDPALLFARAVGSLPDRWQASVLRSTARQQLLLTTRQAGKSTTTAAIALHTALYQAPALVLLLSPSLRQSQELFVKVAQQYTALGQPVPADAASALRLTLANGSRVIALPGSEATIRGYSGVALLLVDEAARVADDLYRAVRPMLAVSGGRLVLMTTPFGKRGVFHDEWEHGEGWERTRVTAEDCPRISPHFLEQERRTLGERWFNQEYLCSFEDDIGAVFSYQTIMNALDSEVSPLFTLTDAESALDPRVPRLLLGDA